jgi:hypothetical protein
MATPKKEIILRSPLVDAFNNIVSINRSRSQMRSTQNSYKEFLRFMNVEIQNIESIKLPDDKKIKKLANINVTSTFGSAGSLLSSLASGALDAAGLVGNFFGGGKKPNPNAGKAIPKNKGVRLGGIRALGIANAALAGLDFAQGLQEGESVGKAAAGAGGNLAGSLLGGAIGTALIPFPPLGFIAGSMLGGMVGGYLGDRAHESMTGQTDVEQKTKARLKEQEKKQKAAAAASLTAITFPEVLDKFDSVVTQFERSIANLDMGVTDQPHGYDEELGEDEAPKLPDGTTDEGADSVQYGTGNAEFGETGNVSNSAGWVHGHFQSDSAAAVTKDTTMVVKALLKQGSPVFLNPGVDLLPSKQYSDAELTKYVDNARRAHTHSGAGKSIDVFVRKGTKVPVPLTEIKPTGPDFGGYGRGGLAGYIQGTRTWIGHLKPGSKSGLSQQKGEIKSKGKESGEMEDLYPGSSGKPQEATARSQTKPMPTAAAKPSQDLSQMSMDQLKGMLDPTMSAAANPVIFQAAQTARVEGQESGLTGEDLERAVMIATIRARNAESQVAAMSQQLVVPQQLEQYPAYDMGQSSITLIPMMMGGGGGGSQQRPMVISSGGGGGGTTILPPIPEGQVLNSLFKTILLTNLSGT